MSNRREFLAIAGAGMIGLASPPPALARLDETWLTYAPDAELFWKPMPILARLKKVAEAGFTRYEFGSWKTKDIDAVARLNEELGLQASLLLAYRGFADPKRKEAFVEAVELSVAVAQKLGSTRLAVLSGDPVAGMDREAVVDAAIEALKAASEKVAESEVTLILDPLEQAVFSGFDDAAEILKEVDSKLVRLVVDVARHSEAELAALIARHKASIGLYRVGGPAKDLPKLLKLVHDAGMTDPVGVGLKPKGDPLAEIDALRKADAAAKVL